MVMSIKNNYNEVALFGGKAKNLLALKGEVNIPNFIVIDTHVFERFISYNDLTPKIKRLLRNESIEEASNKIKELFIKGQFSEIDKQFIIEKINGLNEPLAVRSSANVEDLGEGEESFAGAFDSILYVNKQDVEQAIKRVFGSLYNVRLIKKFSNNFDKLIKVKMAVIIQEMVTNGKYGVALASKEGTVIQAGLEPSSATKGRGDIDTYFIDPQGNVTKYNNVHGTSLLFDFEIEEINKVIDKLNKKVFPIDIEFAFKYGEFYLLQQRKLNGSIPFYKPKGNTITAFPISEGIAKGKATVLKHNQNIKDLPKGKDRILVAEEVELQFVNEIQHFGGVCIEIPGIVSHAAIFTREHHIPCVGGALGITEIVKNDEPIEINGSTGEINIIDRPGLSIKKAYSSPVNFVISYKDLKQLTYKRDFVLLFENELSISMFHVIRDKQILKDIVKHLQEKFVKPVQEGSMDVWYAYANILELSSMEENLLNSLSEAERVVKEGSEDEIKSKVIEYVEKGYMIYKEALKKYKEYKETKRISNLVDSFIEMHKSLAYASIGSRCMLFEFMESRVEKDPHMIELAKKLEEDEKINKKMDEIRSGIDIILDELKNRFGIDYADYSSLVALKESILKAAMDAK